MCILIFFFYKLFQQSSHCHLNLYFYRNCSLSIRLQFAVACHPEWSHTCMSPPLCPHPPPPSHQVRPKFLKAAEITKLRVSSKVCRENLKRGKELNDDFSPISPQAATLKDRRWFVEMCLENLEIQSCLKPQWWRKREDFGLTNLSSVEWIGWYIRPGQAPVWNDIGLDDGECNGGCSWRGVWGVPTPQWALSGPLTKFLLTNQEWQSGQGGWRGSSESPLFVRLDFQSHHGKEFVCYKFKLVPAFESGRGAFADLPSTRPACLIGV